MKCSEPVLVVRSRSLRLGPVVLELSLLRELSPDSGRLWGLGLALRRRLWLPLRRSGTGSAPDSAPSGADSNPKSGLSVLP